MARRKRPEPVSVEPIDIFIEESKHISFESTNKMLKKERAEWLFRELNTVIVNASKDGIDGDTMYFAIRQFWRHYTQFSHCLHENFQPIESAYRDMN